MPSIPNSVIKAAQETERKYNVPASITIAQWALESGYGTSNVARNANNFFGIKKGSSWSGATYGKYRAYSSMQESFDDHGKLLSKPLYANKTANAKNAEQYIKAIAETYAPSSDGNVNYVGQIMTIINRHNLTQYDSGKYGNATENNNGSISNATGTGTVSGFVAEKASSVLSAVVSVCFTAFIMILAFIFIISAFDIKVTDFKVGDKIG